ncbi:exopolyphosphatase/guanosine-5'-triphosphate,3'-diphosphate pyrophosphatase [Angulomicrobium tetraedrale]|uniref:Exopolyphosphatase/guanosine-5'-triphosphate, 3'-diphosphate pyrophosphatase n=1 Tax=Ancylobacter tetraedralis TaxID=217068 RepID=A0A839Z5K9_9HYPH|nr:Ppx/GppA phosphatase family protein [Ancylobacter tetraedralis]MBB3770303.1 exopolyphosphatase/guanosine-5'-triphosphate,3'-diphosphate pyrophosphatase [Ancylobacter tetraedralis]
MNDVSHEAHTGLVSGAPIAVIDIGSNSVRLVVYERLSRSPTPIFNEKASCGLGREVATTGRLNPDAVAKALSTLKRFRVLCDRMGVGRLFVLATAAARDAANGPEFVAACADICRTEVGLLSGKREAQLSALGVLSGVHHANGVVGDLGGGSLELADLHGQRIGSGVTFPLGGLALQDTSGRSLKKAAKIVKDALAKETHLEHLKGRTFYAVGGTWRALARLHMFQRGYPLHVMHGYIIPAKEALEFVRLVQRVPVDTLSRIETVAEGRRQLLAYGALVMEQILRVGKPANVFISAQGVREGLLYEMLDEEERVIDPLVAATAELNEVRSRSPKHGWELVEWTDRFMASTGIDESVEEKRLRHAACLLADISWRAHPDYRGEQSLNLITHAAFIGVDHPGRAFLGLAIYYRHVGLIDEDLSPRIRELVSARILDRARILGAALRVGYILSAAMPGTLPTAPLAVDHGKLVLKLKDDLAPLGGERVANRLRTLARLIGREPLIVT